MSPPDSWDDIHGPHGPASTGFSGQRGTRHDTPYVRRPTCEAHCTGNHERDSVLVCPICQGIAYEVWAHEWIFTPGHRWHEVRPVAGSPFLAPGETPRCRDCGAVLARRWK